MRIHAHITRLLGVLLLFSACPKQSGVTATQDQPPEQSQTAPQPPTEPLALGKIASGRGAAVATAHPLATEAAAQVLADGGNAVDAWITASLVIAVTQPQSSGIGGGGFALVRTSTGEAKAYDFREEAPMATALEDYLDDSGQAVAERSRHHGLAVGVPGLIRGLADVHRAHGVLQWSRLVMPATEIAEHGFAVGRDLARAIEVVEPFMSPAAKELFYPDGKALLQGQILKQPALAQTLKAIADDGPDVFYQGPIAEDIVATVADHGGVMNVRDLAGYETRTLEALVGEGFGHTVLTMPQPSAGGAQVLAMAEFLSRWSVQLDSAVFPRDHAMAESMRRSFLLRLAYSGDATQPARTIDDVFPADVRNQMAASYDQKTASSSDALDLRDALDEHPQTTHISVVDGDGMVVSSTHTVNLWLGSAILTSQTGIILNNELDDFSYTLGQSNAFGLMGSAANLIAPGARPVSSMAPTIVLAGERPVLVVGTPGGTRIPTTIVQVMERVLTQHQSLVDAVRAPRLHHQAFPDQVWVEEGVGGDAIAQTLGEFGHEVERKSAWCNVMAIVLGADGLMDAVADPRGEGAAWVAHPTE